MICPWLRQSRMMPVFSPAIPPTRRLPVSSARFTQSSMTPVSSLIPAIPPRCSRASPVPEKVHPRTVPRLVPTMPPAFFRLPSGFSSPSTARFSTRASWPRYRNSPRLVPDRRMEIPRMVWPLPAKVPQNTGTGENAAPPRSRSASRLTRFPWEKLSEVQLLANSRNSSAVRITRSGVSRPAAGDSGCCPSSAWPDTGDSGFCPSSAWPDTRDSGFCASSPRAVTGHTGTDRASTAMAVRPAAICFRRFIADTSFLSLPDLRLPAPPGLRLPVLSGLPLPALRPGPRLPVLWGPRFPSPPGLPLPALRLPY